MCDIAECEEDKIHVWVFWKEEEGYAHMFWSRLCYKHYLESKERVKDNAYFYLEEET
jgi:hypothetical protein